MVKLLVLNEGIRGHLDKIGLVLTEGGIICACSKCKVLMMGMSEDKSKCVIINTISLLTYSPSSSSAIQRTVSPGFQHQSSPSVLSIAVSV